MAEPLHAWPSDELFDVADGAALLGYSEKDALPGASNRPSTRRQVQATTNRQAEAQVQVERPRAPP